MSDKYNQRWVRLFAKKEKANGITIGQTTYYDCPSVAVPLDLRRHEDMHKKQWKRHGGIKFVVTYLWSNVRYGYEKNPYEIEARAAENG